MTVQTQTPQPPTTVPQKLNGGLQEPQINIYWPQLDIMWQVTRARPQQQHSQQQQQQNQQPLGASDGHLLTKTKLNLISNNKQDHNINIKINTAIQKDYFVWELNILI